MAGPAYVVVGAGAAGVGAVEGLREGGFDGPVVLVDAEAATPYDRTQLSKRFLRDGDGLAVLHSTGWYAEHGVELLLGAPAVALDRAEQVLRLSDGRAVPYAKLLLATGASARPLQVPGADLPGVSALRTLEDARALRAGLARGGRVVVVGGGWVGLEAAAGARAYGAQVTVLEPGPAVLADVLGVEMGEVVADLHRGNGVDVRTSCHVEKVVAEGGRLRGVLVDGTLVPADTVVVALGALPATDLALAAGLPVDGGVLVDPLLRTEDPAVYAAGDCARVRGAVPAQPGPGSASWTLAREAGRAAGLTMAGVERPLSAVPYYWSEQYDTTFRLWGWPGSDGYDEVVVRGEDEGEDDETQEQFDAFWLRGGRVVAALSVNTETPGIVDLVAARPEVDPAKLADPGRELALVR